MCTHQREHAVTEKSAVRRENHMEKKRTAAYCRVSTTSDTQDGSFEVQCEYYEKRIKEDPGMELVGVYGDHGKSGRSMRGRKELNRLIKDCEAGKIDLVLTKSSGIYLSSAWWFGLRKRDWTQKRWAGS